MFSLTCSCPFPNITESADRDTVTRRLPWNLVPLLAFFLVFAWCCSVAGAATPQVAASGNTSMAVDANGILYGWGDNGDGLLGRVDKSFGAIALAPTKQFARGFIGSNRLFLLDTQGVLWGAGSNQFGQLGDGSFFLRRTSLVRLGADFTEIAAGTFHTLAIKTDGSLWTWGSNEYGQLGDSLNVARARPFRPALGRALSIAAGMYHSLAVLEDGSLWAWGNNEYGQLGDGTSLSRGQPIKIGDGYVQVAAGDYFSLARKADGTVMTWGQNSYGQLGDGSTTNRSLPGPVSGRFGRIVASSTSSFALDASGGLWHWGASLSSKSTASQLLPNRVAVAIKNMVAGERHLLLQRDDGGLYALGSNDAGELGTGDDSADDTTIPVKIAGNPTNYAAGGRQSLLIDASGHAFAWGDNTEGQLAQGRDDRVSVPVVLATGVRKLALNGSVAYVVREDSSLWGWGKNDDGRLGDGGNRSRSSLVKIGDGFESVSNANTQALGLKTDGSLWAWGRNDFGQLGLGDVTDRSRPVKVGDGFQAVAAGAEHTLALKIDGSLWAWGRNRYGQLGNGQYEQRVGSQANPIPQKIGDGYVAILAGAHHSVALKNDGSVWAWGWNDYAQIGDGTTESRATPVRVATQIARLLSANINTIALGLDGKTYVWGYNGDPRRRFNLLQAGTDNYRVTTPTAVSGNWTAASSGSSHAVYLRHDGIVFSLGYQQFGQLGDGAFDDVRPRVATVLGVNLTGLLDLQPATAKQLQPGDEPTVVVKTIRQGDNNKLSMGVQVRVTGSSSTVPGLRTINRPHNTGYQMYVVAGVPLPGTADVVWFSLQPQELYPSPTWAGIVQPLAVYLQNISSTDTSLVEFDILENLDTTLLAGANLYLGYGLSQDEMVQSQRFRIFYVVPSN